jgi:hypothetical protein
MRKVYNNKRFSSAYSVCSLFLSLRFFIVLILYKNYNNIVDMLIGEGVNNSIVLLSLKRDAV